MKKVLSFALAMTMVLGLAACGNTSNPPSNVSSNAGTSGTPSNSSADPATDALVPYEKTQFITFYCTSPGGTLYDIAATYMPLWQEYANINVTINPGGSIPNLKAVSNGETELAFTHHTMAYLGAQGDKDFFEGVTYGGVNLIAPMTPAAVQVVTTGDSKINSLSDLSGSGIKLGLGIAGSTGNAFIVPFLEEEYGISLDSIVANGGAISYISDSEAPAALLDGQIDVFILMGVWPKPTVQEVEYSKNGIKLIDMDEDKLTNYLSHHPEWARTTIPAGSYTGQDKDINAVSAFAIIACNETADEEMVYKLTRVIWELYEEACASCKDIGSWMHKEDIPSITNAISLHPGAERYYKEIGLL